MNGGVIAAVEPIENAVVEDVLARVVGLRTAFGALSIGPIAAAVVLVANQKATLA